MRMLIVYGTGEGQTRKIAEVLARQCREVGHDADLYQGDALPRGLALTPYAGVLVGASVHMARHQPYIRRFIQRYLEELRARPCAFFSVSAAAASPDPESQAQVRELVTAFLAEEGWQPGQWAAFAGAVPYTRYGRLKRWMMRQILRRAGGPTDTSRDWEFTDWEAVRLFGEQFLQAVSRQRAGRMDVASG
ncbi:flavodoxin domain-containing protein [Thiohalorhabdus sp. Cl-TMA]|uniref:Flavodoxin domain-containing protein n=1 Tax=Thiohalorhabdus methylotrophus TaxID=3242694 RepID=A0ABV4TTJ3_9GAMM